MRKDKRATRAATTITLTLLCAAATFAQVATSQTLGGQTAARPRQTIVLTVAKPIPKTLFASVNKPDVDLRPEIKALGISIRPTQNGRGTCSVFAMTFLLEFMYAKHFGMTNADLSEEYLNYASNNAIGAQVDGGFFDQIDPGYQKFGMVQEFLAPYLTSFQVNLPYGRNVLTKGMALQPRLKPHYIKKWDCQHGSAAQPAPRHTLPVEAGPPRGRRPALAQGSKHSDGEDRRHHHDEGHPGGRGG